MSNRPKRPRTGPPIEAEPGAPPLGPPAAAGSAAHSQPQETIDRPRKKLAPSHVPGRVTALRPRVLDSHSEQEPLRAIATVRGFPDADAATRYLLNRAEELLQDGVPLRLPVEPYLDALLPVLAFIYARGEMFREANLGPEVCGAVEYIAQEIQSAPDPPMPVPPPANSQEHQVLSTGALLLTAYRDAIRRVARGPKGLVARASFGVTDPLDVRDPEQVIAGVERFLQAATRHAHYVEEAGLSRKQLEGLAAQRRVLVAIARRDQEGGPSPMSLHRSRVLHAALEYFFDRFSAVVSAKLFDRPDERLRGLRLVPRDNTNRAGGLRSTDPR